MAEKRLIYKLKSNREQNFEFIACYLAKKNYELRSNFDGNEYIQWNESINLFLQ